MLVTPLSDWLVEQENRRGPLVFLVEWLVVFSAALFFWTVLLLEIRPSGWSLAAAIAAASIYASLVVYPRLLRAASCRRCRTSLALTQQVLRRRHVRDEERCIEIERGGEEWYGHYLDIYTRHYKVEIVKYRCRRCGAVWEQTDHVPATDYQLIRTIEVKD